MMSEDCTPERVVGMCLRHECRGTIVAKTYSESYGLLGGPMTTKVTREECYCRECGTAYHEKTILAKSPTRPIRNR